MRDERLSPAPADPLAALVAWWEEERAVALATVVETWGSAPCPIGSLMVVDSTGDFRGSVSGGCVEGAVIAEAMALLAQGGPPRMLDFGVADDTAFSLGLACGGRIRIFVEAVGAPRHAAALAQLEARAAGREYRLLTDLATGVSHAPDAPTPPGPALLDEGRRFLTHEAPPMEIVAIGAVHVAQVLAQMAAAAGLGLRIVDPRGAFATDGRFPEVDVTPDWPQEAFAARPLSGGSAVLALTHDPRIDDPALMAALAAGAFHIGALGSRKTHAARLARLRAMGAEEEALARIRGPIGLPIGAKGPAEIAVAILAEVIAARRRPEALPALRG